MRTSRFILLFTGSVQQAPCLASAVEVLHDCDSEGFQTCIFYDADANTAEVVDLSDDLDEYRQVLDEMESDL